MMPWDVFAPNKQYRACITPGKRGRGGLCATDARHTAERRVRIIACIEERDVIDKTLAPLDARSAQPSTPEVIAPTEPGAATTGVV